MVRYMVLGGDDLQSIEGICTSFDRSDIFFHTRTSQVSAGAILSVYGLITVSVRDKEPPLMEVKINIHNAQEMQQYN